MSGITQIDSNIRLQYPEVLSLTKISKLVWYFSSLARKSESHFGKIAMLTCQQLGTIISSSWINTAQTRI